MSKANIFIVYSLIVLGFTACNCNCTQKGCIEDSKPFSATFPSGYFNLNELNNVFVVRATTDNTRIDSVEISPYLNEVNRTVDFLLIESQFGESFELNQYHYLFANHSLHQTDTVSFSYTVSFTSEICNSCTGGGDCEDEYYKRWNYQNEAFNLNGISQNGSDIVIEKQ